MEEWILGELVWMLMGRQFGKAGLDGHGRVGFMENWSGWLREELEKTGSGKAG